MSALSGGRLARSLRGPLLLLLPIVLVAGGLFFLSRAPRAPRNAQAPRAADPEEIFEGFAARAAAPGGSILEVRLTPLHADAGRQSFDSDVLRARLALEEGAPWRLQVRWVSDSDSAPSSAGLRLDRVRVEDERGIALGTLEWEEPPQDELHDPLHVLLRVPDVPLAPGEALDLILWGRAPGKGARVAGWIEVESADLEFAALALRAEPFRRRELGGPLAQLAQADRRERGKNPSASASPSAASPAPARED